MAVRAASLIEMAPASIWLAMVLARSMSREKTQPDRPNSVLLAKLMAWASVSKGITGKIAAKVSSVTTAMVWLAPTSTVGSHQKPPPFSSTRPPVKARAPWAKASAKWRCTMGT